MHAANRLRLTLRPPANTVLSRGYVLPLVHLINCKFYYYFIFNCHFKFKGMQCNVYVYRIREILKYFTRYFCRHFRFNLKNVGMGHAKKLQNVKFTMLNPFRLSFSEPKCAPRRSHSLSGINILLWPVSDRTPHP